MVCWRLGCRASILGMKVVYIAGNDIDSIGPELLFLNVNCKIGRLCGGQWKMPRPTIIFFCCNWTFYKWKKEGVEWYGPYGDDTIIIDEGISNWSCLFLW